MTTVQLFLGLWPTRKAAANSKPRQLMLEACKIKTLEDLTHLYCIHP